MNGWFIAHLMLMFMSLGIHLAKHGEPKEGTYNFGTALISAGIQIIIVYMAIRIGF